MSKKIFIIHGWTYTIKPWTSTVSILRQRGYTVEQLQVPGLTEPSDDEFTVNDYVNWLEGKLKGEKKPIVIGHSNGGRIALNYLAQKRGVFDTLILLNSAGINVSNERVSAKRRVFKILATIGKPLKYIPLVRKVVYRLIGGSDYDRAPANMKQTLNNMLGSDASLDLGLVDAKVQILWGGRDQTTPLEQGRKMARDIAGAHLEVYGEWAHAPYITHPYELANALETAIKERK